VIESPEGAASSTDTPTAATTLLRGSAPGAYLARLTVTDGLDANSTEFALTAIDPAVGPDTDEDGLSDAAEAILGTDPAKRGG